MSGDDCVIKDLPLRVQKDILLQTWEQMTARYQGGWTYGKPVQSGELTATGDCFLTVLGRLTVGELRTLMVEVFRQFVDWPPQLNQIEAQVRDVVGRRPPKPLRQEGPRPVLEGDWVHRTARGKYSREIREQCEVNPQWGRQPGESGQAYRKRMAGEFVMIGGGKMRPPGSD